MRGSEGSCQDEQWRDDQRTSRTVASRASLSINLKGTFSEEGTGEREYRPVDQHLLGQLDAEEEEIRDAFTGDRRCWNHRDNLRQAEVNMCVQSNQSVCD